jgi:hypothetical protein
MCDLVQRLVKLAALLPACECGVVLIGYEGVTRLENPGLGSAQREKRGGQDKGKGGGRKHE